MGDLLQRYQHYVPLWDARAPHIVGGVRAQLKPAGWRELLESFGDDKQDYHFIMDGVMHGFKIVDADSQIQSYSATNYKSATRDAFGFINDLLLSEIDSGKLSVTSVKPTCIHALGAVPKSSGGFRPISDASRPEGRSVNCFMSSTFQHFKFSSIDDICEELTRGAFLAVSDISAAYRSVLIRPEDRQYQGLSWVIDGEEQYLSDNFLSFGTRVAPYVFNKMTDLVSRGMRERGYTCFNYLDDFLLMADTFEECRDAQLSLHKLLRDLGFYIAFKKVSSPAQVQRYLGIDIDTVNMKLALPADKMQKLQQELVFFKGRRKATHRQLQRLCGILSHCSTLVKGGRTFSHRVIGLLKGSPGRSRYVTLTKSFHKDLEWWTDCARWFNGEARIIGGMENHSAAVEMDASGLGYGAVYREDWLAGAWGGSLRGTKDMHGHYRPSPDMHIPDDINIQELYPLLESLWRWGEQWRNSKVVIFSDNTQVVSAINKGKCENDTSMRIMRRVFWLTVLFNCHLVSVHIPGRSNVVADALSRLLYRGISFPNCITCCRGKPVLCRSGQTSGGSACAGMVEGHVEDEGLAVEALHRILHAGGKQGAPHGRDDNGEIRGVPIG